MNAFRIAPVASVPLVAAGCLAAGCHFNATYNNRPEGTDKARKVTDRFYDLARDSNYSGIRSLFGSPFFAITDSAKPDNLLHTFQQKPDAVDRPVLDTWQSEVIRGTDAKSDYVLRYRVRRKKFDSKETFTLLQEAGQVEIVGCNVISDGFLATDSSAKRN